jgi:hemolysin D
MSGTSPPLPLASTPARLRSLLKLVPDGADERAFLPAALEIIETPASPVGRAIAGLIAAAAVTAVIWASLAKIDIIATAPGRIIPVGQTKIMQPFQAGIVQAIDVADGDHVVAGQALIILDPTSAEADARRVSQDLLSLELDRARLEGLRAVLASGAAPVLLDVPANATREEIDAANAQMQAQALEEAGKIADIDQQIAEKRSEAQQAVASIAKVETDKPYLSQVAGMRTTLLHDAVGSKLDWLTAQQQLADTGPEIAQAQAQQQAALASVAALQQQRAETQGEYATGIYDDLDQTDQKIGESSQDLVKAQQAVTLTTLRAPISGTVQQLMVHTIGGIVTPAQALLTIVPDDQQLMVEASIQNQDIGFVHVGQEAEVKIAAFDFTRYGAIRGKVVSISRDVVDQTPYQPPQNDGYSQGANQPDQAQSGKQDDAGNTQQGPEYVAHIMLGQTGVMTDAGEVPLEPGMAVTADVKTGRRRVISYPLSPFTHQIEEAGRER